MRWRKWDDKESSSDGCGSDDAKDPENPLAAEVFNNNAALQDVSISPTKRSHIHTKMFPTTPPRDAPAPKQPKAISFALSGGKVVPRMPNAVGNMVAAASPAKPRRTSKPISFRMNGVMIAKIEKPDEPQRKISRRP